MDDEEKQENKPEDDPVGGAAGPAEDEASAPPPPPEKKVHLNDDPQFFELDPNSTDVKPLEKNVPPAKPDTSPRPCPPLIDQEQLDQIIADTLDIVDLNQKLCNDQKLETQKLAFMLNCIKQSIQLYGCHLETLNTFLVNDDALQTRWFCQTVNGLRGFGDYTLVLKNDPEKVKVDGLPVPVPESELKSLTDEVVDAFMAGGYDIMAHRTVCKFVNDKLDGRRDAVREHLEPFDSWFVLLNKASVNQDIIRDMLFKVAANVSFLKTGEISDTLVLDLSKELQTLAGKKQS